MWSGGRAGTTTLFVVPALQAAKAKKIESLELEFLNFYGAEESIRPGYIGWRNRFLESIPGLLKSLHIRALSLSLSFRSNFLQTFQNEEFCFIKLVHVKFVFLQFDFLRVDHIRRRHN